MGTLSKRGIEEFGDDIKDHIDDLRNRVGRKLDASGSAQLVDENGVEIGHEKARTAPGTGDVSPVLRSGIAHQVERVMVGVPTATWITLAGATLIGSFALRLFGRRAAANLFSGWAPVFLVAGLYNKLTTVGAATALLSSRRWTA